MWYKYCLNLDIRAVPSDETPKNAQLKKMMPGGQQSRSLFMKRMPRKWKKVEGFERLINWHGFISHCFMRKGRMARGILPDSERFRTERGFEISQRMKRLKESFQLFLLKVCGMSCFAFFLGVTVSVSFRGHSERGPVGLTVWRVYQQTCIALAQLVVAVVVCLLRLPWHSCWTVARSCGTCPPANGLKAPGGRGSFSRSCSILNLFKGLMLLMVPSSGQPPKSCTKKKPVNNGKNY